MRSFDLQSGTRSLTNTKSETFPRSTTQGQQCAHYVNHLIVNFSKLNPHADIALAYDERAARPDTKIAGIGARGLAFYTISVEVRKMCFASRGVFGYLQ